MGLFLPERGGEGERRLGAATGGDPCAAPPVSPVSAEGGSMRAPAAKPRRRQPRGAERAEEAQQVGPNWPARARQRRRFAKDSADARLSSTAVSSMRWCMLSQRSRSC